MLVRALADGGMYAAGSTYGGGKDREIKGAPSVRRLWLVGLKNLVPEASGRASPL
jgi:hypothetical protein